MIGNIYMLMKCVAIVALVWAGICIKWEYVFFAEIKFLRIFRFVNHTFNYANNDKFL